VTGPPRAKRILIAQPPSKFPTPRASGFEAGCHAADRRSIQEPAKDRQGEIHMNKPFKPASFSVRDMPMLIDGELVHSESGQWLESTNPATEELLGRVPLGSAKDVERAVTAAEKAQPAWAELAPSKRAEYLMKLSDGLAARAEEILHVEVMDTGNTITKMRDDVKKAIDLLKFFAGLGYELKGQTVPATPKNLHLTVREPYGVVGRIIPFNHPINFAASRMAAPLMAGNAIIEKPSEQSPLSAAILAEVAAEVMPKGIVNIITGTGAGAGDALVKHPRVKRIAFIGSVKTGMAIQRSAAEVAVKNVSLELGGKNPMIVFPDADYETALSAAISGMNFAWQGQSCSSTSRCFIHESMYDKFVADLAARVDKITVGDPLSPDSKMGPINSKGQYEKVLYYINAGKEDGAKLVAGGARPDGDVFKKGYWVRPAVFADVKPTMRIAKEEIFGPVLSVFKWKHLEEAIEVANSVEYGLTAAIWTKDINTAINTARKIQSGHIWINGTSGHYKGMPFGGFKNSGIGREGGLEELLSYTEEKAIHIML
jgi:acyl-CoA reductase-like NAD-dependent aldehyde dehydrogenase